MKWTKEDLKRAEKVSNELVSVISYFDGLRSASIRDPKELVMKTKTSGLDSAYLKYFSKETQKVLKKIGRSGKVRKMIRVNKVLNFVTLIYFMIVVALAILLQRGVILPSNFGWMYWTLSWPSIILLFILADVTLLMLSLTKYELKKIAEESGVKEEEAAKRRLKEAAQHHIDKLRANIEKYGLKPEDYKIKLQRTDYEGIRVIKKPGVLHGYYLAIVNVKFREKKWMIKV